jgi:hypothetical protein
MGYDENTDWKRFSLETKALYTKISKHIKKEKAKSRTNASLNNEPIFTK